MSCIHLNKAALIILYMEIVLGTCKSAIWAFGRMGDGFSVRKVGGRNLMHNAPHV